MTTWFDRLRGISQGRVEPFLTPPDGSRIFVLGEEAPNEEVRLSTGDRTQIRQIVDLTGWDFIKATMDTIGRVSGSSQLAPSWSSESAELFKFYFDISGGSSVNAIIPAGESVGFSLDTVGPITYPTETYSGSDTYCRGIPAGTIAPAHLLGIHTPPVATPTSDMDTYTFQVWVNFDIDSHATSWGVDFNLMSFYNINGPNTYGFKLSMLGLTGGGAHMWYPFLTHYNGAASSGVSLDNLYDISENQGWQLLTITFDSSEPALDRVTMFLNDTEIGHPSFSMGTTPAIPEAGSSDIQFGGMNCWGQLDACRLLDRVLSPAEVATSYTELTTPGVLTNTQWVQKILVDNEVYARRVLRVGEERRWTDFIAPVRRLSGQHKIAFRLELEEV